MTRRLRLLALLGAALGALLLLQASMRARGDTGPKFRAGDCVTSTLALEDWERPVYWRILRVGRANYLARVCGGFDREGGTWLFSFFDDSDKRVACPGECR